MLSEATFKGRLSRALGEMERLGLDCLLVFSRSNQLYLTGSGAGACTVVAKGGEVVQIAYLLEAERARLETRLGEVFVVSGYEVEGQEGVFVGELHEAVRRVVEGLVERGAKVGLEAAVPHATYSKLAEALKGYSLVSADVVSKLRRVKAPEEVELIEEAVRVAEEALRRGLELIEEGVRECEVAAEVEREMRRSGCWVAFETIVASGPRSALPHGYSSLRELERGDLVVLDLGARWRHYCSDITRTAVVGQPSREQRELLESVLEAQRSAIDAIEPGVKASEVDAVARRVLRRRGLARHFIHSLGHGVGLLVHEAPTLSPKSKDVLEPGMVFTVEPGVYIKGLGGVRIEDMVLATERGAKLLTALEPIP